MKNVNITYCAEISSNHVGSLPLALAHIKGAKEAGANAVKFQMFRAETLDARPEVQARLAPYELPIEWLGELSTETRRLGMQFGVTPFDVSLVPTLRGICDFVKVAAYDLTFDDLVAACASLGVPIVLSTAMATEPEILHALSLCGPERTILHGVAQYPAMLEDHNLAWIAYALDDSSPIFAAIGLSDHTLGYEAAMLAVTQGATWIEKHFKLPLSEAVSILGEKSPRFSQSPDFEVSSDPWRFAYMVGACQRARDALGDGQKNGPRDCELPLYGIRRTNQKRTRG
jgi:N-acetylneuraminate synthase